MFKEAKSANPPFLYIRVIPYLIQLFIVIVSTVFFIIDQFVINFIPSICNIIEIGTASVIKIGNISSDVVR